MNNKGFTLVELLAVVIILTLLIGFVMPQITNSVNNYREKTDELTTKLVLDSAKLYVEDNIANYPKKSINNYCISLNELIENEYLKDKIKLNDKDITNIKSVRVIYDNNKFNYELVNSSDCINYKEICEPVTNSTVTTGNVPEGNLEPGDEYICEVAPGEKYHFFVVSTKEDKVSLIMDRNINSDGTPITKKITKEEASENKGIYNLVEWLNEEDYRLSGGTDEWFEGVGSEIFGPITAMNFLEKATKHWKNVNQIYLDSFYDSEGNPCKMDKTYKLNARLIYYDEVERNSETNGRLKYYLYGNLNNSEGYWTLFTSDPIGYITIIYSDGARGYPGHSDLFGVRPVIEITKDNITKPICKLISDFDNSGTITPGDKYSCEVKPGTNYNFYVLSINNSKTTNLIMDQNINSDGTPAGVVGITKETNAKKYNLVAWNIGGTNVDGPVTAIEFLYNATKDWKNIMPLNYTYKDRLYQQQTENSTTCYTSFVSENGVATLKSLTGNEVVIGSKTSPLRTRLPIYANIGTNEYGEVANKKNDNSNAYLTEYIDSSCSSAPYGYWTLSSGPSSVYGAWNVTCSGKIASNVELVYFEDSIGVRPVIELENKYIQN